MKLHRTILVALSLWMMVAAPSAAERWSDLYKPRVFDGLPCRVMKPLGFDAARKYPVIVSLHGAGGKGANNDKHLKKIKALIKGLQSVDMNRIYVLGHSMGGHGSYIFIQLDPAYFAAAAPSAGSGLRRTEKFIDAAKIKDVPIWAFHGDQDGVCPIEKDREVFAAMKKLGGNMKLTTWAGDRHGVSGKFIPGADNGTTECSSDRCDKEQDFMTWLFKQKRSR